MQRCEVVDVIVEEEMRVLCCEIGDGEWRSVVDESRREDIRGKAYNRHRSCAIKTRLLGYIASLE